MSEYVYTIAILNIQCIIYATLIVYTLVDGAVLSPNGDDLAQVSLKNCLGITQKLEKGLEVGNIRHSQLK